MSGNAAATGPSPFPPANAAAYRCHRPIVVPSCGRRLLTLSARPVIVPACRRHCLPTPSACRCSRLLVPLSRCYGCPSPLPDVAGPPPTTEPTATPCTRSAPNRSYKKQQRRPRPAAFFSSHFFFFSFFFFFFCVFSPSVHYPQLPLHAVHRYPQPPTTAPAHPPHSLFLPTASTACGRRHVTAAAGESRSRPPSAHFFPSPPSTHHSKSNHHGRVPSTVARRFSPGPLLLLLLLLFLSSSISLFP